ncbi:unnamed protein product [Bursaphelenchus xylophilus]|uniref:(pine wood nematode) hypothetical protein n=1 Tax=Bursaphelenchus xylophilus TaxID=6326 RepID=A0A1I7RSX4_BURXY|nr:unnamed protein product [Bursaphelenchus xylophilus]CAG9122755.1 unnamed protein product [Bursaphelenchus xylophilus]
MNPTLIWSLLLLMLIRRLNATNYINFVVSSVKSEERSLSCDLQLYNEILSNTIANISFDCSPGIDYQKHQLSLNGTLTYPIVFLLSIRNSETKKEVYTAYSSLNTLENAPNYMKHKISSEQFTMIYNTSLQCADDFVGRYCNISCEPPKMTDHYVCSRDGKVCNKGWLGPNCDQPYCQSNCSRHGQCVSPGVCVCDSGWIRETCNECIRREGCVYGSCSEKPYSCKCKLGYSGPLCDRHISSECVLNDCVHGQCAFMRGVKVCHCDSGYHGKNCDQTIPKMSQPSTELPIFNQMSHQYWNPPPPPHPDPPITLNTLILLASFTCLFCSIVILIQKTYKYIQKSRSPQNPPIQRGPTLDEAKFFASSSPPPPYPVDNPKLLS